MVEPQGTGLAISLNAVFRNLGSNLGAPIASSLMATYAASVVVGEIDGKPIIWHAQSTWHINVRFSWLGRCYW
jgi:hypothetical protein